MTNSADVTVVIPSKDRPRSLDLAVRSVLAQREVALEVVVVDDASDPPVRLSDDVALDPRVRLLRLDPGQGPGAARNLGVAHGRGAAVAFLDDDDTWRPWKLSRQLRLLQSQSDDVAGVDTGFDYWDGDRLQWRYLPDPGVHDLSTALLRHHCLVPSTLLLRRRAFESVGGFDSSLVRNEDWELWIRLADRYRFASLVEVHADRQHHEIQPALALSAHKRLLEVLEPRINKLPPRQRRRVQAFHEFQLGLRLEAVGDARGRRAILRAWRADPARLSWLAHAGLSLGGPSVRSRARSFHAAVSAGWPARRKDVPLSKG